MLTAGWMATAAPCVTPRCPWDDNTPLSASPRVSQITRPRGLIFLLPALPSPEKGQNVKGPPKQSKIAGWGGPQARVPEILFPVEGPRG